MIARRPVVVVLAGILGVGLAAASVLLPRAVHLQRPDLIALVAGLTVLGGGIVLVRSRAVGPVGGLVLGAGYCWFLPALAVTSHSGLDVALRSCALLHIALLVHAVVVVGARRVRGVPQALAIAIGYLTAITPILGGGYRLALPATGIAVTIAVLADRHHRPPLVRRLRTLAGLVLGLGLIGDALLREVGTTSLRPEALIAIGHPVEIAVTAVLLTVAGTRRTEWGSITPRTDNLAQLTTIVADELGAAADLRIAFSDGAGGWLLPTGEAWGAAPPSGIAVDDGAGKACAVLAGTLSAPVTPAVSSMLRLAAVNARLRASIVMQVDELEASRRRLLAAADWERAALGARLRSRVISHIVSTERELARSPELGGARERTTTTRRALESIAHGIDPIGSDRSLRQALEALVATAPCEVRIERCDEPRSREVARALWFCVAEAASNTAKHSPRAALEVSASRTSDSVEATLTDDGLGDADARGPGLLGLADRVETLGGTLRVLSPTNAGTVIEIVIPDPSNCGQPQVPLPASSDSRSLDGSYRDGDPLPGGTP